MFFFVKRLKSVDPTRRLEENCKDVVSLDDSPAAPRQKSVRPAASTSKKRNAADKDAEKEEVMPKKKRRDTDSDSD
ncbi:unnamed protein product, partial [Mesorhabditis belari]|uniref:Uncharacterized protein n=1 Tax=Mesorhabditis belari TaxID=2138241 RepID=A0AAF3EI52_9BILA